MVLWIVISHIIEYEDVPRGRVVYDIENTQYIIYSNDDIIISDEAKSLIIDKFKLIKSKTLFKYDSHYKI